MVKLCEFIRRTRYHRIEIDKKKFHVTQHHKNPSVTWPARSNLKASLAEKHSSETRRNNAEMFVISTNTITESTDNDNSASPLFSFVSSRLRRNKRRKEKPKYKNISGCSYQIGAVNYIDLRGAEICEKEWWLATRRSYRANTIVDG